MRSHCWKTWTARWHRKTGRAGFPSRTGSVDRSPLTSRWRWTTRRSRTTWSRRASRAASLPDEWVLLGNHHDAWVFGGVDPSSGTASMMEMTRAFGDLLKQGKRPRRTLVFASWDGEEIGLTGSTEWGEQFSDELRTKLVAYLNVDSSAAGPNFHGGASGSLAPMLVETTNIDRKSRRRHAARCVAEIDGGREERRSRQPAGQRRQCR